MADHGTHHGHGHFSSISIILVLFYIAGDYRQIGNRLRVLKGMRDPVQKKAALYEAASFVKK